MDVKQDEDEDDFKSGDAVVEPCSDGLVHMFRFLDDGQMEAPACGSPARPTGRDAKDDDVVCQPCILLMAKVLGCNTDYVKGCRRCQEGAPVSDETMMFAEQKMGTCPKGHVTPKIDVVIHAMVGMEFKELAKASYCGICYVEWMGATFPVIDTPKLNEETKP